MIEFVPLKYYYDLYIYFCFFLVVANMLHAYSVKINSIKNLRFLNISGITLFVILIFYLGLRPVSVKYFGDMGPYFTYYRGYMLGLSVKVDRDITFHYFMKLFSFFAGPHSFFLTTVVLYVFPMYKISKIHLGRFWFYGFLMFVVSFSFYTYGVNGVRNGVATSLFLWGLCFPENKVKMGLFFIIACLFHKTLLLPVLAYMLTLFYNNPKTYLKAWGMAIPLSLFAGSLFISLFTSLGFGDERLAGYLSGDMEGAGAGGRFRWDFLFYSAFPVFAGWYFIIKRQFRDVFYNQVFNTYLVCNAFWILVIRANFSNRFAYLSWFLMAFIIIYPLLKERFFKHQEIMIAKVATAYFMFTFLMYFIYYNK